MSFPLSFLLPFICMASDRSGSIDEQTVKAKENATSILFELCCEVMTGDNEEAIKFLKKWLDIHRHETEYFKEAATFQCEFYNLTPLHALATGNSSFTFIETLVEKAPGTLKMKDKWGNLTLHRACSRLRRPSLAVLEILLQAYPESIDVQNDQCKKPSDFFKRNKSN
mmetsp:Transcript_24615/g.35303  ORF Transcript_24615/g.35303 Transcript_24615/m.35303 type:complete len:168 (-) Transcript_24615:820-1323(-)